MVIGISLLILAVVILLVAWFRWEFRNAIPEDKYVPSEESKPKEFSTEQFLKREKGGIITEDEIRHTAYLLAASDNFVKSPETYWHEAEKSLKG